VTNLRVQFLDLLRNCSSQRRSCNNFLQSVITTWQTCGLVRSEEHLVYGLEIVRGEHEKYATFVKAFYCGDGLEKVSLSILVDGGR
jgi:hypothetical protein